MAPSSSARPTGITILAVVAVIGGIAGIMAGLSLLALGGLVAAVLGPLGGLAFLYGLVMIVLGGVEIWIGVGFWGLKPASWRWGGIYAVARVGLIVVDVLVSGLSIGSILVTLVVSFLLLYYLNKANVRQAFAAPASGLPIVGTALDPYFAKLNF
jgi:hypothetical protein